MKKLLNFEYGCIHGTYWMYFGIINSFASVFLLGKGYSNSEIGVTLAVANVLAVVLQPIAADIADRSKRISVIGITEIITAMMMIMTACMFICQGKTMALSLIFVLLIAWITVLQPLFNSMAFKLEGSGVHINFGVTRAMGSLAYSALVAVLGTLVQNYGVMILPLTGEVVLVMLILSLVFIKKSYDKAKRINQKKADRDAGEAESGPTAAEKENINLTEFVKNNRLFFVVNIGVLGIYCSNAILNNYMMQIISVVGGDSEDMGRVLALMAFLEIPTMVCFDMLRKRFSCELMIKVAAVGFTVKIGMCYIATSVAMIFIAQLFQIVSFALFLPAMVHFIDETMRKGEAVKGQALFTTMITITTVFSSLAGGVILDVSGARMLMLFATLSTAVGAAIVIAVIDKVRGEKRHSQGA